MINRFSFGDGIMANGSLIGYEHRSHEHLEGDQWVFDITTDLANVQQEGRRLLVAPGMTTWRAFDLDCCVLLHNCFFAQGQGLPLDQIAVRILRESQPGKPGIDSYAVFGRTSHGQVNGLRGTFLRIEGGLADRFMTW